MLLFNEIRIYRYREFVRQYDCEFLIMRYGFVEVSVVFFSPGIQFFQRVIFYCYRVETCPSILGLICWMIEGFKR
jgi:hypothetical protein